MPMLLPLRMPCLGRRPCWRGPPRPPRAQAAARVAVEEHVPLMAVLAGRELGGEEGEETRQKACEQMGRPLEVVLQELGQAQGESLPRP